MLTERHHTGTLIGGLIMIGLGLLFLIAQTFSIRFTSPEWPYVLIGIGATFLVGMFAGGRSTALLAVPGALLVGLGLIFLYQTLMRDWSSWAYAWAAVIVAVGAGLSLAGWWGQDAERARSGLRTMRSGAILLILFGALFEVIFNGFGGQDWRQWLFAALVLGLGLIGLFELVAAWPNLGRRSLVAPALLALAGGAWLLVNAGVFGPERTLDIWRYWPVLLILFGLELFLGGRGMGGIGGARGSGRLTTERREVHGIERVNFAGVGDLIVELGPAESLTVEAEDNVLPIIRTEVHDGTLRIRMDPEALWRWPQPTLPIRFELMVERLAGLELSGAGNISAPSLIADQLDLGLSGTGDVRLNDLQARSLRNRLSGAGNLTVSGAVSEQETVISGAGSFHGAQLESARATVQVSGAGNAEVWATEDLSAGISGVGSIKYAGHPQLHPAISGLGKIEALPIEPTSMHA
jgi:hypothetical protein